MASQPSSARPVITYEPGARPSVWNLTDEPEPTILPAPAFQEKDKGSIEIGKLADLTVLSNDVMKIPELAILKTRCLMTVIGGEIVYESRER